MAKKKTVQTITVPAAGAQVGLGRVASYAAVARGDIPVVRLGRKMVVPADWLDRRRDQAEAEAAEKRNQYAAKRSGGDTAPRAASN
jgi:hypothetical protein